MLTPPNPPEKEGPFLPRMNDGGTLSRFGEDVFFSRKRERGNEMLKQLGQILLAGIFIKGGADAFLQPGGRVDTVASAGLPNPKTAVELNGAAMVVGGTMLALDIAPRLAAAGLIGSLVPTTVIGHAFWKAEDEAARKAHLTHFLKNLGLLGGLLLIVIQK
jgi:putative oxidoreductase